MLCDWVFIGIKAFKFPSYLYRYHVYIRITIGLRGQKPHLVSNLGTFALCTLFVYLIQKMHVLFFSFALHFDQCILTSARSCFGKNIHVHQAACNYVFQRCLLCWQTCVDRDQNLLVAMICDLVQITSCGIWSHDITIWQKPKRTSVKKTKGTQK